MATGYSLMSTTDTPEQRLEAALEQALDAHAEYYIRQTMKFFQENGESPAISRDNEGDTTAKAAILAAVSAELRAIVPEKLQPMRDSQGDAYLTDTQDGWNQAIDTMITNAKARGLRL